jgi:predicted nicotinamide N-methyase
MARYVVMNTHRLKNNSVL